MRIFHLSKAKFHFLVLLLIGLLVLDLCQGVRYIAREASAPPVTGEPLPIIMYHHINERSGAQGDYVITPQEFESDLAYLTSKGYHTVTAKALLDAVKNQTPLPPKSIMLTFDDGFESNLIYASPLLKAYGMTAVIAVVGSYSDQYTKTPDHNLNYSHVTWEQVKEMHQSGLWEIANHTYNLHEITGARRGAMKSSGESADAYKKVLTEDVSLTNMRIHEATGEMPLVFAYPYGFISDASVPILKEMGFPITFGVGEHVNQITNDPECLYGLGRYNRPSGISSEAFFKKILPH